jgi:hypothetical protein
VPKYGGFVKIKIKGGYPVGYLKKRGKKSIFEIFSKIVSNK